MLTLLRLAIRNVLRNRRRTAITVAALVVGVTAVVTIRGLLNGLQGAITESTVKAQLGAVQVHHTGYVANVLSAPLTLDFAYDDALKAKLAAIPHLTGVAPRIQFGGSISVGAQGEEAPESLFFTATALDPIAERQVCPKRQEILAEGSVLDDSHVILSDSLVNAFNGKKGDEALVMAPDRDGALNGDVSTMGGALRSFFPGEPKLGLVPLSMAQRLLRMEGRATELAIAVDDLSNMERVATQLRASLGPDFEVHTWESVAPERRDAMARQNVVATIISGVFLILMLLGVANALLMSVLERTREVGTMMAVGLTRFQVGALFLFEALVLGVFGVVLGLLAGGALTSYWGHTGLPMTPPGASVALILHPYLTSRFSLFVVVLTLLGSVLFALYPAMRASRLRPVDALAGR